jgi:hypothetical protein
VIRGLTPALISVAIALSACGDRVAAGGPTATAERDGVRLRMELDKAEIRPGEIVWASLTIENTTDRDVRWVAGGCKVPGNIEATSKQDDAGKHWPGVLGTFKQWLLKDGQVYVYFVDEVTWDARALGGRACPAAMFVETLPAKGTLRSRFAWDGQVRGGIAPARPAPSGSIDVIGSISLGDTNASTPLRAGVSLRVRDGGDGLISAATAVDKAYEDGRLARWLEARPAPSSLATPLPQGSTFAGDIVGSLRLDRETWVIRAAQKSGSTAPSLAVRSYEIDVRLSARDGRVLSVVER